MEYVSEWDNLLIFLSVGNRYNKDNISCIRFVVVLLSPYFDCCDFSFSTAYHKCNFK